MHRGGEVEPCLATADRKQRTEALQLDVVAIVVAKNV